MRGAHSFAPKMHAKLAKLYNKIHLFMDMVNIYNNK